MGGVRVRLPTRAQAPSGLGFSLRAAGSPRGGWGLVFAGGLEGRQPTMQAPAGQGSRGISCDRPATPSPGRVCR